MTASRVMRARKNGTCTTCRGPVFVGQSICLIGTSWSHTSCAIAQMRLTSRTDSPTRERNQP